MISGFFLYSIFLFGYKYIGLFSDFVQISFIFFFVQVPFGPGGRELGISRMYALTQTFGVPSSFFTFCVDDKHSELRIRLSFPSTSNEVGEFPTGSDGLRDKLRRQASIDHHDCADNDVDVQGRVFAEGKVDLTELGLRQSAANNPVAAAEVYGFLFDKIFEILFGVHVDNKYRITRPVGAQSVGIFGRTRAIYAATETQQKLTLHAHVAGMVHFDTAWGFFFCITSSYHVFVAFFFLLFFI